MKHPNFDMLLRSNVETLEKWDEWIPKIPFIKFPSSWKIKVIPPRTGAMARFLITKEGKKDFVSVYLDVYGILGYMDNPYWEVYPVDGDTSRHTMNDIDGLLKSIKKSLKEIS